MKLYTKNLKLFLSLFIYLVINSLFIAKYISRLNIDPTLPILTFTLLILFIVVLLFKFKTSHTKFRFLSITLIIGILAGILLLQYLINPYKLQVDRWSAIYNFLDNLFHGEYPYMAKTHLGGYGSPFPVWQIFHAPFYFLGNTSLAFIFVLILFAFAIYINFKWSKKTLAIFIFFAISPAFWYEAAVRSDMMYNFILVLTFALIYNYRQIKFRNSVISLGIITGLFLSTRLAIVIPFFYIFSYDFFRTKLKQQLIYICTIIVVFILTFMPFILWNASELFFFKYNPFILQTRQGAFSEVLLLALMFFFWRNKSKNNEPKTYFYTSITLFIFVTATIFHRMLNDNFTYSLFNTSYDITYFNMAIPFLIYVISHSYSIEKKDGR